MPTKTIIVTCAALLSFIVVKEPAYAAPKYIRDQCNQTSGDGQGHSCPGTDMLLIRPKYSDGTCGDWICCPPNPDGQTYDCAHPVNPTMGARVGALKGLIGPAGNSLINPSTGTTTVKPQTFSGARRRIMRRGIEGDQPGEPETEASKESVPVPSEGVE